MGADLVNQHGEAVTSAQYLCPKCLHAAPITLLIKEVDSDRRMHLAPASMIACGVGVVTIVFLVNAEAPPSIQAACEDRVPLRSPAIPSPQDPYPNGPEGVTPSPSRAT